MSTVLLLEPDLALVDIWRVALESSGHEVVVAFSASAGADQLASGGFDVVVVDTDEEELELLVAAMHRLPEVPPLVLVSASPDAPDVSARVGAAAFLPKPCSPGDLDAVVGRVSGSAPHTELSDEPTRPREIPE